jgi:Na+/H+ antiporter NhaD/arsenite permease-like protein
MADSRVLWIVPEFFNTRRKRQRGAFAFRLVHRLMAVVLANNSGSLLIAVSNPNCPLNKLKLNPVI